MSSETKGLLLGTSSVYDVKQAIEKLYGNTNINTYNDISFSCSFLVNGTFKNLFFCKNQYDYTPGDDWESFPVSVKAGEGFTLLMGLSDDSLEIVSNIIKPFGGHILENNNTDNPQWDIIYKDGSPSNSPGKRLYDYIVSSENKFSTLQKIEVVNFIESNLNFIKSL